MYIFFLAIYFLFIVYKTNFDCSILWPFQYQNAEEEDKDKENKDDSKGDNADKPESDDKVRYSPFTCSYVPW